MTTADIDTVTENKTETETVEASVVDQQAQAKARAATCSAAIQALLEKHQCQIVPMLTSEPVGTGPSMKMMLGATYGILPEVED